MYLREEIYLLKLYSCYKWLEKFLAFAVDVTEEKDTLSGTMEALRNSEIQSGLSFNKAKVKCMVVSENAYIMGSHRYSRPMI